MGSKPILVHNTKFKRIFLASTISITPDILYHNAYYISLIMDRSPIIQCVSIDNVPKLYPIASNGSGIQSFLRLNQPVYPQNGYTKSFPLQGTI